MSICIDQSNKTIAILISYKIKYRNVIGCASCLFIFYTHRTYTHISCHSISYRSTVAPNHTTYSMHVTRIQRNQTYEEVTRERERENEQVVRVTQWI